MRKMEEREGGKKGRGTDRLNEGLGQFGLARLCSMLKPLKTYKDRGEQRGNQLYKLIN